MSSQTVKFSRLSRLFLFQSTVLILAKLKRLEKSYTGIYRECFSILLNPFFVGLVTLVQNSFVLFSRSGMGD